jgi:hypothetical protein
MSDVIGLRKKLLGIQSSLKAPKGQKNKFGNYNYRSAEDILEALKPLLVEYKATLLCNDRIEMYGEHLFNVTTTSLLDCESNESIHSEHAAMHSVAKKGMDSAQISGSTASYSLKRALGNLFAIDNEQDADATNKHNDEEYDSVYVEGVIGAIKKCDSIDMLQRLWKKIPTTVRNMSNVIDAKDQQKSKYGEK